MVGLLAGLLRGLIEHREGPAEEQGNVDVVTSDAFAAGLIGATGD